MAAIDDLIAQIEDPALRERLAVETNRITKEKKFGLVFEDHLPELTPIYSAEIRRHSKVALRDGPLLDLWRVLSVHDGKAHCRNIGNGETRRISVDDLVVVRRFGEPIFPALTPVDQVQNGPIEAPWHTLIEADNYHALQLLEYLYAGQVDCIYIDPPYNTGARDWKYNNDYVDANDNWQHSKWLAMMRRRLVLAARLLKRDGVLIVTIDDNEASRLALLLSELFPDHLQHQITIVINPGGTYKLNFARTHEYAFYICPPDQETISGVSLETKQGEYDVWKLRRTGAESAHRHQRPNQFYAIFVRSDTLEVTRVGPSIPLSQEVDQKTEGKEIPIYPIDGNGVERVWRYGRETMSEKICDGKIFARKRAGIINLYMLSPKKVEKRLKTVWYEGQHSSVGTASTVLVDGIIGKANSFPFPKSLYAVKDAIGAVCKQRKEALILDFFSGSGTTLNAVNLLNASDGGKRHCIMVTNNEVSEQEASNLKAQGYRQGQAEWEQHGICQSVTWPRSKYTILGKRDDGSELEGEYLTGKTIEKEKPRKFQQIGFTSIDDLNTAARKKQLVALIEGIPQSEVKKDSAFVVSEKHSASILFDDSQADAWLEALEDQGHITDFYIVTADKATFDDLKARIHNLLGPVIVAEEEKRPMREGFPANLAYFRLDFLDKDHVALGRQFREILPLLWLRAGAIGPRPELPKHRPIPPWIIAEKNPFAVLVDETRFADFAGELAGRDDLTHAFLVTDSEEAFQEMAGQLKVPNLIQLYRDYLENFVINRRKTTNHANPRGSIRADSRDS